MAEETKFHLWIVVIVIALLVLAIRFPSVLAALSGAAAAAATARCRDGSLSFSAHPCGTCSHHGGVSQWLGFNETEPA